MSEAATVLEIPLLLDMICIRLSPVDIMSCSKCCRSWYTIFAPYRFRKLTLKSFCPAKSTFLFTNRHFIRELEMDLTNEATFDISLWEGLRILTLGFTQNDMKVSGDETPSDNRILLMSGSGKVLSAVNQIQRNRGLRTLTITQARNHNGISLESVPLLILQALVDSPTLQKLEITVPITCLLFSKILNHLPQHLRELVLGVDVKSLRRNHDRCDHHSSWFQANVPALALRRLVLKYHMNCFVRRYFVMLLQHCPNLEHLTMPSMESHDQPQAFDNLAQVIQSSCQSLSSLSLRLCGIRSIDETFLAQLLHIYANGLRRLTIDCEGSRYCNRLTAGVERRAMERLINTATASTIEVLNVCSSGYNGSHFIRILSECAQLREFRTHGFSFDNGIGLSALVSSAADHWRCWRTLQVLELEISNRDIVYGSNADTRRLVHRTINKVVQLHQCLISLPVLKSLHLHWEMVTRMDNDRDGPRLTLELAKVAGLAAKEGYSIDEEDMVWLGLLQR
ncbi:MAG: hypothetical protein J3Q66DRAFT_335356 [Benniella sp.]|nr:MAG: hypothetical protein J3Q66DRAFT_335356 [Benniella sp.]